MEYQLAQVNIAKFRLPQEDPANAEFVNNLDRVNAIAEAQPGYVWRFTGTENNAMDVEVYNDPNIILNMSIWTDLQSLVNFVYRNEVHKQIMRRRKEWFDKIDFHMVMWWIESDRKPTPAEAELRLDLLQSCGSTYSAFTFKQPFAAPTLESIDPFADKCA